MFTSALISSSRSLARDWSFGHVRRRRRRQDLRGWRIRHRQLRVVRRRRAELRGDARRLRDDAELDVGHLITLV